MKKTKISVTEAARNFADCVNRAHYQNLTFVLVKNGKAVAQLSPANEKVCTGKDLAEALAKARLSEKEARAWRRDMRDARRRLKPPVDKWR
jgi:antitoxin (DNA-binding transcriptional repressor) of toxin-antitoxin stability system